MNKTTCTIGEAARRTGVSQDTLRYYEKIGLLSTVQRAESGHRRYTETDLAWTRFLTILRATGMPIRRMLAFVELEREGDKTTEERKALLEAHRREVTHQIEGLQNSLGAIDAKIAHYRDVSNSCVYPLETLAGEKDLDQRDEA